MKHLWGGGLVLDWLDPRNATDIRVYRNDVNLHVRKLY